MFEETHKTPLRVLKIGVVNDHVGSQSPRMVFRHIFSVSEIRHISFPLNDLNLTGVKLQLPVFLATSEGKEEASAEHHGV